MAGTFVKAFFGSMGRSSRKHTKLTSRSDNETLSTTNTETFFSEQRSIIPFPADRSPIFKAIDPPLFTDHYTIMEDSILGKGSSGEVRLCVQVHTGEVLACKMISKRNMVFPLYRERMRNEANIHRFLSDHPYVAKLVGVYEDDEWVFMVMEHCKGGALTAVILEHRGLPEAKVAEIITSLAQFLSFSHKKGIVHRDLKPDNILLANKYPNDSGPIKVADFGNAFQIIPGQKADIRRHVAGTLGYIAPEVLRGESYGTPIDVWSAGVILCNLFTRHMPFRHRALVENRAKLNLKSNEWKTVPVQAQHLIMQMLNLNPAIRITAAKILVHPWIKKHAKLRLQEGRRGSLLKRILKDSDSSLFGCFAGGNVDNDE